MNAPHIGPKGENKLSPAAQLKAQTILAMMKRGMRYEDAYAALMATQPRNGKLPEDRSHNGMTKEAQGIADRLADAIAQNPGNTRAWLEAHLQISENQFHRAIARLRLQRRAHCKRQVGKASFYYAGWK